PLVDTYNPAWLAFSYGDPPPDQIDAARGVLTWTNLTDWTGYIPPHGIIEVTTVFTALGATDQGLNRAEIVGASDWYGNDMGGGADDVPITIIGPDTTPTATPGVGYPTPINTPTPAAPTSTPKPDQPRPSTPAPQPTPTLTPYPTPTVTATVFVLLPETGKPTPLPVGLRLALLVIGSGVTFLSIARRHH
ncbi:MAG: hypothetical protein JW981_00665, partial [Anaerolineae bacterium]|nr:hypothetical protein [Anaerolineae bacterium]